LPLVLFLAVFIFQWRLVFVRLGNQQSNEIMQNSSSVEVKTEIDKGTFVSTSASKLKIYATIYTLIYMYVTFKKWTHNALFLFFIFNVANQIGYLRKIIPNIYQLDSYQKHSPTKYIVLERWIHWQISLSRYFYIFR